MVLKKVLCILDNNFLKYDGFLREVPVVPVEQILDFYSPNVTVIIATIKKKFLIEMASQLIKLSIPFSFYEEIFDGVKILYYRSNSKKLKGHVF